MTELTHTKNNCSAHDICLGGVDGLFCGNCGAGLEERTIHGTKRQAWADIHDDYKATIGGVKFVVVMDEKGTTVSMQFSEARRKRLI